MNQLIEGSIITPKMFEGDNKDDKWRIEKTISLKNYLKVYDPLYVMD